MTPIIVTAMITLSVAILGLTARPQQQEPTAILVKFEAQKGQEEKLRKDLLNYVQYALLHENNIMAEAYYEQDHPSTFWIVERWNGKPGKRALPKAENTIYLHDLEPLSREEWRKEAAAADTPITIMLFVDSKPGTEAQFMHTYHTAMPHFRSEPGVINYQLSRLLHDSTQFVTYEKFRNEAAFQYHLNFPPIQPVIDYLNTSIKSQPFQQGLHRLVPMLP